MSDELVGKFRVQLEGKDELNNFFDNGSKSAEKFSANLRKNLATAGGYLSSFAGKAKSELSAFAGKELGGSLGSQARGVLQLRDAINKLAVSAGGGNEMVGSLKDQIQAVSVASNQLQGDVTDALSAFVERTGDIETARKNIELYARTATAASASLADVAMVGESLASKFNIKGDQTKALAILMQQAKQGSIELRDVATHGGSIMVAARAAGIGGKGHEEQGVREIGGFMQAVAAGGKGRDKVTAADAAVMVQNLFSQVRQKASKIEDLGVKVAGRDYIDVVKDIITKTNGDPAVLGAIFKEQRSFRAISALATQYTDAGGKFTKLDSLINVKPPADLLTHDFNARTSTGEAKLKAAQIALQKFADKYLGSVAEFAAAHAQELNVAAIGLGLAGKGLGLLGRAGGAVGGKIGGALSSAGASRVFVVNWPAGGLGSGGGAPGSVAAKAIPLIGTALALQEGLQQVMAGIKTGGGLTVGDAMNSFGNFDQKKLDNAVFNQKAALFNKFQEENAAKNGTTNNIKIEIRGEEATVTEDNGTRSKVALERRNAEGG